MEIKYIKLIIMPKKGTKGVKKEKKLEEEKKEDVC